MNTKYYAALLWVLVFFSGYALADYTALDKVVAVADEDVITQSELDEKIKAVKDNIEKRHLTMPKDDELRKQVLDNLILDSLQLQMAKQAGITVDEEKINQAMVSFAKQNGFDLAGFRAELERQGMDYQKMREQMRQEMLMQQVQQGHLQHRIQITDQEVNTFLASAEGQQITATRYHLAHILLAIDEEASSAENNKAKQVLLHIQQQLQKKQLNFERLIKGQTVEGYAISGQDLGWQLLDDVPSLFADYAKQMHDGEISAPIRSGAGWHLLYLAEKTGGNHVVEQIHARHILVKPSEVRNDAKAKELADKLYQQLQNGDDFSLLAKEYSEDKGSALQGGDLGWSNPGQFVPEFENALNNLNDNDISQPIKTQFGWHIIQRLGKRQYDLTKENWIMQAKNAIYEKKFADELESWLAKIRSEAFVEIK